MEEKQLKAEAKLDADADIYDQEIMLTVMKINKIFITVQLT